MLDEDITNDASKEAQELYLKQVLNPEKTDQPPKKQKWVGESMKQLTRDNLPVPKITKPIKRLNTVRSISASI